MTVCNVVNYAVNDCVLLSIQYRSTTVQSPLIKVGLTGFCHCITSVLSYGSLETKEKFKGATSRLCILKNLA